MKSLHTNMETICTIAPTTYLNTLAELKAELGIEHTGFDAQLESLRAEARDAVERESDFAITAQTWRQTFDDCWPIEIVLDKYPVTAVVVTYYDENNTLQTLSSSEYYFFARKREYRIKPKTSWPNVFSRPDTIIVTCTCGMATVPTWARAAALAYGFHRFVDRGDGTMMQKEYQRQIVNNRRGGYTC